MKKSLVSPGTGKGGWITPYVLYQDLASKRGKGGSFASRGFLMGGNMGFLEQLLISFSR